MSLHLAPPPGATHRRFYDVGNKPAVDIEARTCELSFSSSAPVDMGYGVEVLSHAPGAADLSRLNSRAPVLFNHDRNDILGVVERAFIKGNKGRAVIRFGKDARGEWAMRQAADGVLVNVSFGYRVGNYIDGADGELIAQSWEGLEISLVTVAADKSVGIGRSINFNESNVMDESTNLQSRPSRSERAALNQQALVEEARQAGATERGRMLEIGAMGRRFNLPESTILAMQQDGVSVDDARARAAEIVTARAGRAVPASSFDHGTDVGLSSNETQSFSLVRAIRAIVTNDWSDAGLERAASRAVETRMRTSTEGFFVPSEVMRQGRWGQRAAYAAGASITGGATVGLDLQGESFIEVLRNSAVVGQAGATILSGLQGNVDIPRQISATPTFWVAEGANITEGEATFDLVSLRPKTVGALSMMSRLLLLQSSPSIEQIARNDLAASLGVAVDLAALSGSGASSQPLGIAQATGVSFVLAGSGNGGNLTLDVVIAMERKANEGNMPMAGRAYFVNPKAASTLKTLKSSTGQYLWTDSPTGQRSATPHMLNGYPVFITNQVRGTLTAGTSVGVCSEIFFACWPEVVIGEWGSLEIVVNPYRETGFAAGAVWVRAMQTLDVALRRSASLVMCTDALTP